MKKCIILIFTFVLFCASSDAQNNTFSKVWDQFIPISHEPLELEDGSFIAASGLSTAINYTRIGLVRFKSNGVYNTHNWLWGNQPASRNVNKLLKLSNNSFVTIGEHNYQSLLIRRLWFTKWNMNLDTTFTKSYIFDTISQAPRFNNIDFQKNILITGYISPINNSSPSNGAFTKMDSLGNLIWQKTYITQMFNKRLNLLKVLINNPNEYLLLGGSEDSTANFGVFLMKTDTSGQNFSEFSYRFPLDFSFPGLLYTSYPNDAIHLDDGSIVIAGSTPRNIPGTEGIKDNKFLIKVNNNLELIWAKLFESNSNINTIILKLAYLNNKIYGLVNTSPSGGTNTTSRIGIACFDEDGNELWEKLSQPTKNTFDNIITTSDGSILITGVFDADQITPKTWVLKLDEFGCVESNCEFLNFEEIKFNTQFKIFPNPASQSFQIQWSNPIISDVYLTIVDALGKTVYKSMINQTNNNTEINIDHLSSGVYFVQLSNRNQILGHKKLIKQ